MYLVIKVLKLKAGTKFKPKTLVIINTFILQLLQLY